MATHPIRLALFSGNYNAIRDGVAVSLNRLVGFLERKGVEVIVFAPTIHQPAVAHAGALVPVPSVPLPGRKEYRIALGLPQSCRRKLAAFRPNLFHISTPDFLGLSALRLAKRSGIPAVASFHTRFDTYLRYYGARGLEKYVTMYLRYFYGQCDQVYVPSESIAAVLREQRIGRDLRLWTRGVDSALFNPGQRDLAWRRSLGIGDDEVVISFVGRLVREKGLKAFANVLDTLRAQGFRHRALIIGEGPERQWMRERLPEAIFTGYLEGQALARGYASADVFFFPSVTETFGIVTLEAMASGVPSVCTKATGSSSLVAHGVSGFLAAPDQEAECVGYLSRLISDAELRRRMGKTCVAHARAYDWDASMGALLSHYEELMEVHRTAAAPPIRIGAPVSPVSASASPTR